MSLFIGIDSGTQSTKAVVLDLEQRKTLARAQAPHALIEGLPAGHMEQHPRDWTQALDTVIAAVVSKIGSRRAKQVRGIGISGQQHGLVVLDAAGEPIRPAKLWCDTSTAKECALLTAKLGGAKAVLRKTGVPFLPGYTAPKLLWLKRNEPANFRRLFAKGALGKVLLPHDYLNFYLTGRAFMEYGDASGTALMDVRRRQWSRAAIDAIDPRLAEVLPPLSRSDEIVGTLLPQIARRYGLPADTIVSAGGGDNMMGAIGTGNVRAGVVTASFGTSGTIYAYAQKPVVDPEGEIAAFCDSTDGWLPLLCTMNVTTATEAVRGLFGQDHAAFNDAVASLPAGADGLVFLPYLAGERTPNVPNGTGALLGLTTHTLSAAHLARAAMEGVTLGMNYGLRRLAKLGVDAKEIRVTGGGARSSAWRQIMADVFGARVVPMVEDEGAALGGAIQAAWALQRQTDPKAKISALTDALVAVDEARACKPDKHRHALYSQLQAVQDKLSLNLRDLFTLQEANRARSK
ncbi:xylulokinase [Cephaloticoccus primus]|uniref:Xylulose kinase n=1 Tax=Cephaloticoccus primus TaxID=1548207 RepID=A0A139SMN8_9BACT|nr:xylulokinase [Cephaloticoccus primus]KXU35805.1 xylulokinase [Cephaloticoccus primus]